MGRYEGTAYEPRTYRQWTTGSDLVSFTVVVKETDLLVRATSNLTTKAHRLVLKYRGILERYIQRHPEFLTSLRPVPVANDAPRMVTAMSLAADAAGVGPMAAVAGAIAEFVGSELLPFSPEIIVENGGDIYLKSLKARVVGVYAGQSPLSRRIGIVVNPEDTPLGICTSSGTVGHSLSLGEADAVAVVAKSAALADAAATAVGNVISDGRDIERGIELAKRIAGVSGVLVIKDDHLGLWGVEICRMSLDRENDV